MAHTSQRNLFGSKFVEHVECSIAKHSLGKFFGPLNYIFFLSYSLKMIHFSKDMSVFCWFTMGSLLCLIFRKTYVCLLRFSATSFMKSSFLNPSLQVSLLLPIRHEYNPLSPVCFIPSTTLKVALTHPQRHTVQEPRTSKCSSWI